ncbi:hypothetical protein XENOCAPTIV_021634, partial [Xenoophorus captivus]
VATRAEAASGHRLQRLLWVGQARSLLVAGLAVDLPCHQTGQGLEGLHYLHHPWGMVFKIRTTTKCKINQSQRALDSVLCDDWLKPRSVFCRGVYGSANGQLAMTLQESRSGLALSAFSRCTAAALVTVFVLVCVLTLIVASPDSRYSKAGLYAIFATQSNDFALGYPIGKTHLARTFEVIS